ncbi:MAG: hypothetical protein JO235_18425, partial [Chroococcidiopsidaceae cyanobacterium CP_BM_RX_35]|nr:hypothetical protein [Chroococcidiopsidaceae cyanobacterium CP_BM_RX_35]
MTNCQGWSIVTSLLEKLIFEIAMLNPNLDDIQLTKEEYERYSRHIILPEV